MTSPNFLPDDEARRIWYKIETQRISQKRVSFGTHCCSEVYEVEGVEYECVFDSMKSLTPVTVIKL